MFPSSRWSPIAPAWAPNRSIPCGGWTPPPPRSPKGWWTRPSRRKPTDSTARSASTAATPRSNNLTDYDYTTAEYDLHGAANLSRTAGFTVIEDNNEAEFGTAPAPLRCDNAALYSGWYSHAYNNAFTWNPGAIGFHIDSSSLSSPRVGTNWSGGALQHGITVTSGSVAEPYLFGLPHPDQVFRNLFEGANVGDAFLRGTRWLKWMIVNVGDPLYRPFPNGFPAVTAPVNTLAFNPQYVVGGKSATGTVNLAAPAPSGGASISLHNPQPGKIGMPATVTVPAGASSASFPISTTLVTADAQTLITASFAGNTLYNTFIPEPLLSGPTLPCCAYGGSPIAGVMVLNDNAPAGGIVVNLSSSNPAALTVPATVAFPAGSYFQPFTVTTYPVDTTVNVTLQSTYAGATESVTETVIAPVLYSVTVPYRITGGQTVAGSVAFSSPLGPSGAIVTLSSSNPAVASVPASLSLAAGATTASFNVTTQAVTRNTTVTVSATSGSYTRTATFTVTP